MEAPERFILRQWLNILGLQPREKAAMFVVNTTTVFCRIYLKMEFSSQSRKMLLFLITNIAAVTSHANQQVGKENCL